MRDRTMKHHIVAILGTIVILLCLIFGTRTNVCAENQTIKLGGSLYELSDDSDYEYTTSPVTRSITDTGDLGQFSISGDIKSIPNVNGFTAYQVEHIDVSDRKDDEGIVKLTYSIWNRLRGANEYDWHIYKSNDTKVNGEKLDEKIKKGAIIVKTSIDGKLWVTDTVITDIAGDDSGYVPEFYNTKGIQQVNGCYYRIIVVYETEKRGEDTYIGPIPTSHYDYKKYVEVYEFYLIDSIENAGNTTSPTATPRKELGKKTNTGKDNGFSGNEAIDNDDPHFGWEIGTFYLNGYTREQPVSGNDDPIFLKTLGDRVTLWFRLDQDINCLRGDSSLSISEDKNGYDQYFGVEKTNFKHGALIIRFTDFEGKAHDPVIYTDYLAASANINANTKVELFEEGDYEVALDYEIMDDGIIDSYYNYRIYFRFKIRNGNCMVYPFDVTTGAELADNVVTENGFKLDMAKSRYLIVDIERSAVKYDNNQYTLDTRENTATQEGKEYTKEGVYSFTVKNPSTGESTTKTIYVGTDPIYKALAGKKDPQQTLDQINDDLSRGGILQEDGSILIPPPPEPDEPEETTEEVTEESEEPAEEEVIPIAVVDNEDKALERQADLTPDEDSAGTSSMLIVICVIIGILVTAGIVVLLSVRKKKNILSITVTQHDQTESNEEEETQQ